MEFDQLIRKMSPDCRQLFEQATATASSRSHYQLDIEHLLDRQLQLGEPALEAIAQRFDLSLERLGADLQRALEEFKTGNGGFPKIGSDVARLLFEGWMLASSQFSSLEIRPAHLLLALVENDLLRLRATRLSPELAKLHGDELRSACAELFEGSSQSGTAPMRTTSGGSALNQFTLDLTAQAREGKIDPVIGRDGEIRQIIDILCRRRQNNPILTGEAGVGKTAVVEGLAQRIVAGEVPENLRGVALRTLDMGLLQAGAGVKGEFENRLKQIIQEVKSSAQPIVLFIDEAHTLIGAGNQAGAGDAANLLKPALARGELRTIAATTWSEYKKYFESDAALTRRFQVVKVEEPTTDQATLMLRNLAPTLEEHHGVVILDEAIRAAVTLSQRYIAGRQLPDKGVSLLDTACARVGLSQHTTPPAVEQCQRRIEAIVQERSRLQREQRAGGDHWEKIAELECSLDSVETERHALEQRWQAIREAAAAVAGHRKRLEQLERDGAEPAAFDQLREQLQSATAQLKMLQGETPMIHDCVDADVVAAVVADWTGIPVQRMQSDEINNVLALRERMTSRVIGQNHALALIAKTMHTARARVGDPRRPLGVFLLTGPSGVGKTETALALAEQLYGSDRSITVLNMSEFKEEHKVSLLMGSPPGYVGYGEGGLLTEAVRRKPYSVVLLDEIEKAHPGVQDIFYQVFDKGVLRDGEGRDIDFKNTVIVLTCNTASEQIEKLCADPDTRPDHEQLLTAIEPTLRQTFKPALLGRLNVIPYFPLDETSLSAVARMQLEAVRQRVTQNYGVELTFTEQLIERIANRCQQSDTGARQIATLLQNTLLPTLAEHILTTLAGGGSLRELSMDMGEDGTLQINEGKHSISL